MNVNPPTSQELFLFSSGKLNNTQRENEIQNWLKNNPLGQDALEGLRLDPNCVGLKTPPVLTANHVKKGTFKFHFLGWGLGLGIGALLALLILDQPQDLSLKTTQNQQETAPKEQIQQKVDSSQLNHPTATSASPEITTKENKKTTAVNVTNNPENGQAPMVLKGRDIMRPFNHVSQPGGASGNNGYIKMSNPCIDILGYRVYPYKERAVKEEINLPGLPANEGVRGYFIADRVPYLKAIEKAIAHYQEKNTEICIFICEDILLQYPDDINALYLIGRCLFEEGNIEQSKTYFEKTLKLNQGRLNEKEIRGYLNLL